VEEIIAVMRAAGDGRDAMRLHGVIIVRVACRVRGVMLAFVAWGDRDAGPGVVTGGRHRPGALSNG
jgi:hypothetical protein